MATKLDIYSDMRVPFSVAAWARGHKYNVTAVAIAKALQEDARLTEEVARLEALRDANEEALRRLCRQAQEKAGDQHAD